MARTTSLGIIGLLIVLLGVLILVPFVLRSFRISEAFEATGWVPYKKPNNSPCILDSQCKSKKCKPRDPKYPSIKRCVA